MAQQLPTADSYIVPFTVLPGENGFTGSLLAGEYPSAKEEAAATAKLARFLDAGITYFLDLTEEGEYNLRPYAAQAALLAAERGRRITHRRMPIADVSTPTAAGMAQILDRIDAALTGGETVYLHCFGGIGRTGTVIGCWLVRHGLRGDDALAQIAVWRQGTPDGDRPSPETAAQRRMVGDWAARAG